MAKRKRTNNDLQNTTHKTKDRVTRTPLKTGGELSHAWRQNRDCDYDKSSISAVILHTFIIVKAKSLWLPINDFNLTNRNNWFNDILVNTNPSSRNSWSLLSNY